MALAERLALLITADTTQAVAGLKKVGDEAERSLGKTQSNLDRTASKLTSAGVGMAAFGTVALVGLGKMARASEDANLATIKLQNSLDNNPRLAGENIKAFDDLATALSRKTVADDDSIRSGMAMLATFRVTGDQVRSLTPLVLDYARKFGVDLVSANAQVGKALDGSVGALKRNGVTIDETLFKTDRYAAVVKALGEQVGGFAEAEGKTFTGQLEIMKHQLGELSEGVGVGVVDAFSSMFGAVSKAAGALDSLAPGTQAAIGKFATFGATGLIAAGATAALVGQLIKIRTAFTTTDIETGVTSVNRLGKAFAGLALIGTAAAFYDLAKSMNELKVNANAVSAALADGTDESLKQVLALGELAGRHEMVKKLLEQSVPAAEAYIAALKQQGVDTSELTGLVNEKRNADVAGARAQSQYSEEVAKGAETAADAGKAWDALTSRIKENQRAELDAIDGAISHEQALRDQIDAQQNLADTLADSEATVNEQVAAIDGLAQANVDAAGAADDATKKHQIMVGTLTSVLNTLQPGSPLYNAVKQYIDLLNSVPTKIDTYFTAHVNSAAIRGGGGFIAGYGGPQAEGGDYMVNRPTMFMAGEAGPERATFTPIGKQPQMAMAGAGNRNYSINVNVAPGGNPAETGRAVVEAIRAYERNNGTNWRN